MSQPAEIIRERIPESAARAVFAPGCFWCLEATFEHTPGVLGAINGYAGGKEFNPSYEQVCSQQTGHREAVLVYYDEKQIKFQDLLDIFFKSIDPIDAGGQFADRGFSYTTAVFYKSEREKEISLDYIDNLKRVGGLKEVHTKVLPYTTFYEAEEYHQDFHRKSVARYQSYRQASGRAPS